MARIQVNTAQVSAALRDAATALKAAIVVAAAAILSQAKADIEANAAAAADRLDAFGGKLDALRDGIHKGSANAAALAVISSAGTVQIDAEPLARHIVDLHAMIKLNKRMLYAVVSKSNHDGTEIFAEQFGMLGRTFEFTAFTAGQPMPAVPFQYDQLFLETIAELGQRDWSDTAGKPAS